MQSIGSNIEMLHPQLLVEQPRLDAFESGCDGENALNWMWMPRWMRKNIEMRRAANLSIFFIIRRVDVLLKTRAPASRATGSSCRSGVDGRWSGSLEETLVIRRREKASQGCTESAKWWRHSLSWQSARLNEIRLNLLFTNGRSSKSRTGPGAGRTAGKWI